MIAQRTRSHFITSRFAPTVSAPRRQVRRQCAEEVLRVPPQLACATSSSYSALMYCSSADASPPVRAPVVDGVRSGGRKGPSDSSAEPRSRTSATAAAAAASASSVVRRPDVTCEGGAGRWTAGRSGFWVANGDGRSTVGRNGSRRKGSGATR